MPKVTSTTQGFSSLTFASSAPHPCSQAAPRPSGDSPLTPPHPLADSHSVPARDPFCTKHQLWILSHSSPKGWLLHSQPSVLRGANEIQELVPGHSVS